MISPVTAVLTAEQRKTMVGTTSSGGSSRRIEDCCSRCSRSAGGSPATIRSVKVTPGITTLTRIPAGPSSFERVRVRPWSDALAAAYGPVPGTPSTATPEETLTIRPQPRARIDRKSTRLNSSHVRISYAVFCLKKKKNRNLLTANLQKEQKQKC